MSETSHAERVILRGAGATAMGFVVRFGARILFLFIAARFFGVALFGAFSLGVAAIEFAVALGSLGSKRILFKRLEEESGDRAPMHVVLDSAVLVGGLSLFLAAALAIGATLVPETLLAPNVRTALIVLAPMIIGQALLDLFLAGTRWTQKIRYEAVGRSLVEPYFGVAAALAAWWLGFRETGLLVAYWAGTLAALFYAVAGARSCLGRFALGAYRFAPLGVGRLVRDCAPATAHEVLSGLFARIDLYLVGMFLGEAAAGVYGMARQIRTPIRQVRQSFDGLLNPIIARTLALSGPAETAAGTASAARLILVLQLPLMLILAVAGEPLLTWFGPEFVAGYWALLLLAGAETIQGAFGVSELIILYRKPLSQLGIVAANIIVNAMAGILLIGPLGVTGAGLSVLIGVAAGALVRRASLRAHFGFGVPLHHSAGPIAAAALAALAAFALPGWLGAGSLPVLDALRLAAALGSYALLLKLWVSVSGESMTLVNLRAAADGSPASAQD